MSCQTALNGAMVALTLMLAAASMPAQVPEDFDWDAIRDLPVQHNGRWMPLDTLSREIVFTVTGRIEPKGQDPVGLFLCWAFDSTYWTDQPLISISNAELRSEIGLPADKTVYSFKDLQSSPKLQELSKAARSVEGRKLDPLEQKVLDITDKMSTLQGALMGQLLLAIPHPVDARGRWMMLPSPDRAAPKGLEALHLAAVELRAAITAPDAGAFATAAPKLKAALAALPAAYRPDAGTIQTELTYNRLKPFRLAWILMAIGAVLGAVGLSVRRRMLDRLVVVALMAGFAAATWGLYMRWQIAGRIPASNMYESLLFLGWGMGAFVILALVFLRGQPMVPFTASFMGALSLMLADILPMSPFIKPIPPVLADTVWMSIHVPVIMVSYSVLALAWLTAHVQIGVMALAPQKRLLAAKTDATHHWYMHMGVLLLTAGILTGSMWAASSWGRYWGWDPKEVWSLVALLGYMAILHIRLDPRQTPSWVRWFGLALGIAVVVLVAQKLALKGIWPIAAYAAGAFGMLLLIQARGMFATAVKSILCFWLIIMTYVGVNYVLGMGLHSYGFGSGAIVKYVSLVGGVDLAFVAVLSLVRFVRAQPVPARV